MNRLLFPRSFLDEALGALLRNPAQPLLWPAGIRSGADGLVVTTRLRHQPSEAQIVLGLSDHFPAEPNFAQFPGAVAMLLLGWPRLRGHVLGWVLTSAGVAEPLDEIFLPGSGMRTISLDGASQPAPWLLSQRVLERMSRSIGALGAESWQRLSTLRYVVVGAGRTGTHVISALARLGATHIAVIDPDQVGLHNLGESELFSEADVGQPKVEALWRTLAGLFPQLKLTTVPHSVTHLAAFQAMQESHLALCTCDHDSARMVVTGLGSALNLPVIDCAVGVHLDGQNAREMGVDVRLALPGRCLVCLGGLRSEVEAREVLRSADAEANFRANRDWRRERAGNLASLSQLGVSVMLRTLEDLVAERVQESQWARVQFDEAGRMNVSYPTIGPRAQNCACSLCGLGTNGLPQLRAWLRGPIVPKPQP